MTEPLAAERYRFNATLDGYRYELPAEYVTIFVSRVRQHDHHYQARLEVLCEWPAVRQLNTGMTAEGELNLSSQREREARAKFLAKRTGSGEDFDWLRIIEDLCGQVIRAEEARETLAEVRLDDCLLDATDPDLHVDRLHLIGDAVTVIYADAGHLKSYLALYVAGRLAQQGLPVLYLDFEWTAQRHAPRKQRMFNGPVGPLWYVECQAPLTSILARIRRLVQQHGIRYVVLDSIVPALDGKPEDSDTARRFFSAARQLPGMLALAHITKQDARNAGTEDAVLLPRAFGSAFFHHLCRCSYFSSKQDDSYDPRRVTVWLYPDKRNEGTKEPVFGFRFLFGSAHIAVECCAGL